MLMNLTVVHLVQHILNTTCLPKMVIVMQVVTGNQDKNLSKENETVTMIVKIGFKLRGYMKMMDTDLDFPERKVYLSACRSIKNERTPKMPILV